MTKGESPKDKMDLRAFQLGIMSLGLKWNRLDLRKKKAITQAQERHWLTTIA